MKILIATTWFPDNEHPVLAPFVIEHLKAISKQNEIADIIHLKLGATGDITEEEWKGFKVYRVPFNPKQPKTILAFRRLFNNLQESADILHSMAFSAILALKVNRIRLPWVHTEHWSGLLNPASVSKTWERVKFLRYALRFPNVITTVTQPLAAGLKQFTKAKFRVIPCVVENPYPITQAFQNEPVKLLAIGALVDRKRPFMALDTVKILKDQGVNGKLTWVGSGPLMAELKKKVNELNLADSFILTGLVPPEDVFSYYSKADIFFLPTAAENFLTSAAEALSAGRVSVVSHVGGFTDYLNDSNSVIIEEPASAEKFSAAIIKAINTFKDTDAKELAATVKDRFSAETIGKQFDEAYKTAQQS